LAEAELRFSTGGSSPAIPTCRIITQTAVKEYVTVTKNSSADPRTRFRMRGLRPVGWRRQVQKESCTHSRILQYCPIRSGFRQGYFDRRMCGVASRCSCRTRRSQPRAEGLIYGWVAIGLSILTLLGGWWLHGACIRFVDGRVSAGC
jgi:hypothetical protein